MPTLLAPPWFEGYLDKLEGLDPPAATVVRDKLRQILNDPFSGLSITELSQIPAPLFVELAKNVRRLFDTSIPGKLSTLPEQCIRCVFDELLIEGRVPPPTPTRAMVLYVARGPEPAGVELEDYFPGAQFSDVAAIILAPVWLRSKWLLIDPYGD